MDVRSWLVDQARIPLCRSRRDVGQSVYPVCDHRRCPIQLEESGPYRPRRRELSLLIVAFSRDELKARPRAGLFACAGGAIEMSALARSHCKPSWPGEATKPRFAPMSRRTPSTVVPADAGTHNHRCE